jgi:hypothetical protein
MAQFSLPGPSSTAYQTSTGAYDLVAHYLNALRDESSLLAFASHASAESRIDAKARGLSPSASHAANQALLNDLLAEAASAGQEVWIGDGEFPCHTLSLYPHQRIDGTGTLVQNLPQHMFNGQNVENVVIRGISIEGTYTSGPQIGGSAIELRNSSDLALFGVRFRHWGTTCVSFENVQRFIAAGCEFNSIAGSAFRLQETLRDDRHNGGIWFHRNRIVRASISEEIGNAAIQAHTGGNPHRDIWITENAVDGAKVALGLDLLVNGFVGGNELYRSTGEAIAITGLDNVVIGNYARNAAAAGLLFWGEQDRSRGLRAMYNDMAGCEQGVALAFGQDDVVFDDVLMMFNRLNNNRVFGAQSYMDGGSTGLGYGNVVFAWNEMSGNANGAFNFLANLQGAVREVGTFTTAGSTAPTNTGNVLWQHVQAVARELATPLEGA